MRWMVPAVLLATAVGCSASHDLDGAAAAWLEDVHAVACAREIRCDAQIREARRRHCDPDAGPWSGTARAVLHGDLRFDAEAGARCIAELDALPCHLERSSEVTPSCWMVLTPLRALGERCTPAPHTWTGCPTGTLCATSDGVSGECVAGGAPGDTCFVRPCAAGPACAAAAVPATCPGSDVGDACEEGGCGAALRCEAGRCAELPVNQRGEPCGSGIARCEDPTTCVAGVCRADGTSEVGEPCGSAATCVVGLWCDRERERCAARLAPGAACAQGDACGDEAPFCTRGVCSTEAPPSAPNCPAGYSGWGDSTACPEGLACHADSHSCRPVVALDELCDADAEVCVEGARCAEGRCRRVVPLDAACGPDALCAGRLECRSGRCTTMPHLGEPCVARCLDESECRDGTCTALPTGAPCERHRDCASGRCFMGVCTPLSTEGGPCGGYRGTCAPGLGCFGDADDVGRCFPWPR